MKGKGFLYVSYRHSYIGLRPNYFNILPTVVDFSGDLDIKVCLAEMIEVYNN